MTHLDGGKKHEHATVRMQHGDPVFSENSGVHGTTQMPISDDVSVIQTTIRNKFKSDSQIARMSMSGDIHFRTHDMGDGTMEVNFEVKQ